MGTFIDINNPSSYKNCSKKQYEIYVCMPPKNTIVINKLEQADVVKALGGKTYFTVEQIEKMQKSNPPMLAQLQQLVAQGRAYAVTDATPFVLCGTVGEMWTIKADKLAGTYNFLQGGQPLAINQQTLNQRLHGKYLDWTLIRTSPQATAGQNMACFVPSSQKGQIQTSWGAVLNINGVGVSHGKGDFIVCAKLPNGQPNLGDRWVVNGEIFATTYNNQGWTDCLNQSSIKNITIDSLPRLVPQQTAINTGVDPNVFKQKCDTIIKELQKIYKFEVESNEYGTVDKCIGFSKSKCYSARYIVEGDFNYKYGNLARSSSLTLIWFVCDAIHSDSELGMVIEYDDIVNTCCKDITTEGTVFIELPHNNTDVNTTYWYKNCRTGSISDINCVKEVQSFKQRFKGTADTFIDNRKTSKDNLNVVELVDALDKSFLGAFYFGRFFDGVYSQVISTKKDSLSFRKELGKHMYDTYESGHGAASLVYAREHLSEILCGNQILEERFVISQFISEVVKACQNQDSSNNALLLLNKISYIVLTNATARLFFTDEDAVCRALWKKADTLYMNKGKVWLNFSDQSSYNVNSKRVCLDFQSCGSKGKVFARCIFYNNGAFYIKFLPNTSIEADNGETSKAFKYDVKVDFILACMRLTTACFGLMKDLPKIEDYLFTNYSEVEVFENFCNTVSAGFYYISATEQFRSDRSRLETGNFRFQFGVDKDTERTVYIKDTKDGYSVKCSLNSITFDKVYKLSVNKSVEIVAMLVFSDICRTLKIHPAKAIARSRKLWVSIANSTVEFLNQRSSYNVGDWDNASLEVVNKKRSININKIVPLSINEFDSKDEIEFGFYNDDTLLSKRVLVVEFNYTHFDMNTSRSRNLQSLANLTVEDIAEKVFSLHYKYSSDTKTQRYYVPIFENDIKLAFEWATFDLIKDTKKYNG